MELLIAILIALGALSSPDAYNQEYEKTYQYEIDEANRIMESGSYSYSKDGGVVINENIDG